MLACLLMLVITHEVTQFEVLLAIRPFALQASESLKARKQWAYLLSHICSHLFMAAHSVKFHFIMAEPSADIDFNAVFTDGLAVEFCMAAKYPAPDFNCN
jgi:hypothetical protein